MDIKTDIDTMKTLLEVYEEYRDIARMNKDGFGFLYWSSRCTECLTIMESLNSTENNPE